jgi:hypothetical protein
VPGYFETFSINEKVVDVTLVKIHEIENLYDPVEAEKGDVGSDPSRQALI